MKLCKESLREGIFSDGPRFVADIPEDDNAVDAIPAVDCPDEGLLGREVIPRKVRVADKGYAERSYRFLRRRRRKTGQSGQEKCKQSDQEGRQTAKGNDAFCSLFHDDSLVWFIFPLEMTDLVLKGRFTWNEDRKDGQVCQSFSLILLSLISGFHENPFITTLFYVIQFRYLNLAIFMTMRKEYAAVNVRKAFIPKSPCWAIIVCLVVLPTVLWAQRAGGEGLKPGRNSGIPLSGHPFLCP